MKTVRPLKYPDLLGCALGLLGLGILAGVAVAASWLIHKFLMNW